MEDPEFDFKSAAHLQDPFPLYRRLQDADPVHWSPGLKAWVITRYDDVVEVLSRSDRFSSDRFRKVGEGFASDRPAVKAVAAVLGDWLVFRDPPDHTRLRALVQKSFTPRVVEQSRARKGSGCLAALRVLALEREPRPGGCGSDDCFIECPLSPRP